MGFLSGPPEWLVNLLPENVAEILKGGGWYAVLGIGGVILILLLWKILGSIGKALFGKKVEEDQQPDLREKLTLIPPPPPLTGDRRLLAEGVPVRLRLVVVAPAGRSQSINPQTIPALLEQIFPGLGAIVDDDQPLIRVWPYQLSYQGFAHSFQNNTPVPEGEDQLSKWILLAGRASINKGQFLLGLGLLANAPTSVGRRNLQMHEWASVLRIRVRD